MGFPNTVLAHGVFDLFHIGHLIHLKAARRMGVTLVVAVTRDRYVNKGKGRPVFNQDQRAEMVKALRIVDRVILVRDSLEALRQVNPDVFVKGAEYKGKILPEDEDYCEDTGIRIAFTRGKVYSSTKLLNDRLRPR